MNVVPHHFERHGGGRRRRHLRQSLIHVGAASVAEMEAKDPVRLPRRRAQDLWAGVLLEDLLRRRPAHKVKVEHAGEQAVRDREAG
jgi:hypothetical protein